jgi:hypothetical protein
VGEKLIRSPSPKGAGGGCIDPGARLAYCRSGVNQLAHDPEKRARFSEEIMRKIKELERDEIA